MSDTTFQVVLTERQLKHMNEALDFYVRVVGLGQLEEVAAVLRAVQFGAKDVMLRNESLEHVLRAAKFIAFGLAPNQSYGIRAKEVPMVCKEVYDMHQVIRKALSDESIRRAEREQDTTTASWLKHTVSQNEFWAASDATHIAVVRPLSTLERLAVAHDEVEDHG
jgi:hypothetical protein